MVIDDRHLLIYIIYDDALLRNRIFFKKMSILRKIEQFNEVCVVSFPFEGDELLYMPLCGITYCRSNYISGRHVSSECVLEYIISGRGEFTTGTNRYFPSAGDIYIAHRGSTHCYRTDPEDRWVKIWFNIQGTLIDELLRLYHLEHVEYIPHAEKEELFRTCFEQMQANLDNAQETATLVAHKLVYGIAQRLYSENVSRGNPIATELKNWIEHNVMNTLSLPELSRKFGYSPSQLIRIFQKEYGETPYQYFLKKKLEMAAVMLRNTRKNIKEIAFALEFSDAYYFSNVFKRHYGISPRNYRKQ